ncbi:MAG: hypothetical protein SGBAC_013127, partial [Bacillariaceae sp.]
DTLKGASQMAAGLYFGIEIVNTGDDDKDEDNVSFLSFYVGYSTWEGRCVFVDEVGQIDSQNDAKDQLYLQILAKIAVSLGSKRLTWKRCPPHASWYDSNPVGPPDILQELHVLHMDEEAMNAYVNYSEPSERSTVSLDKTSLETRIKAIMESPTASFNNNNNNNNDNNKKFSMRLADANNLEDAQAMERLVKGLAIYVKEPLEDILCDASDYQVDGSGNYPLYYSFLLEPETSHDEKSNKEQACGLAVVYFGHSYKGGRYLYLEDLFVDQAYQHQGAGTLALKVLTAVALQMNCQSFQWLALDWNLPALDLYQNKVGAKIQEGKKVTRYTDSKLEEFANGFSTTLAEMGGST